MRKRPKTSTAKEVKKRGKKFRSRFEADVDSFFSRSGKEYAYEQDILTYTLNYHPDFTFVLALTGEKCYIETKGNFTPEDRTKMLAVKKENPCCDIRMVFMRDNKLHRKSAMHYSDWCDKHGFRWYVVGDSAKKIPKEWLEEFKEV